VVSAARHESNAHPTQRTTGALNNKSAARKMSPAILAAFVIEIPWNEMIETPRVSPEPGAGLNGLRKRFRLRN
jgi:hypothetical protein